MHRSQMLGYCKLHPDKKANRTVKLHIALHYLNG